MRRIRAEPGAAQRDLRDMDASNYVTRRPLSLGQTQSLPVPGKLELGDQELELHAADGHTPDGMLVFAPWIGVLVLRRLLLRRRDPVALARRDARRLPLDARDPGRAGRARETIVPGHGSPHDRGVPLGLIEEDLAYLDALERGDEKPELPEGAPRRRSARSTPRT